MPTSRSQLSEVLRGLADRKIAAHSQRFFKSGPGEYGEGDEFLGIRVPALRVQARKYADLPIKDVLSVLRSNFHEERLCALLILVRQFSSGDKDTRAKIFRSYLANTQYVNNWDLVDSSAHLIVGAYLEGRDHERVQVLESLATSESLWERRIAIISTLHFIRLRQYADTLAVADVLLDDSEDLIHKAVGWMLREVGNRDPQTERSFLRSRYKHMPRTMLRYAIEKFPPAERQRYLKGTV